MPASPQATDPLTTLLYRLQDGRQRATYGAVAAVVGAGPRSVMRGRPRDPLHSWVVNAQTGMPTGYAETDAHADLLTHERVLRSEEELRAWLSAPSPAAPNLGDRPGPVAK